MLKTIKAVLLYFKLEKRRVRFNYSTLRWEMDIIFDSDRGFGFFKRIRSRFKIILHLKRLMGIKRVVTNIKNYI